MQPPHISIIMPSYMAEKTISDALAGLHTALSSQIYDYEVIVVIDGFVDDTRIVVQKRNDSQVKIIEHPKNLGKGQALRTGIASATATKYIGYVDSDLDISPLALLDAIRLLDNDLKIDLVVGSKLHKDSQVTYPILRKVQSQIFAKTIDFFFNFGISDTQSGLKLGRATLVKESAKATSTDGFAFDLEFLLRANRLGGRFAQVPIDLNYQFSTTISARKYFQTIREVFSILAISLRK